jgi:transcriptional regulator with XRE-family HTH domain
MVVQRRDMLDTFRDRLGDVIRRSGLNQSRFAAATGVDRSTLSQLLSSSNRRLPRVETLTQVAQTHQVSIDWLLGLTHGGPMQAELMEEQTSFALDALAPNDERLLAWFAEAAGYKVRYVPQTLPDLLKTEAVIRHELDHWVAARPEQKIESAAVRLALTRTSGSDLECCSSVQSLESFARGEGVWRGFPIAHRRDQLHQIAELADELYPMFRWFLFDGLQRYSVPVTVFGPQRAAIYLGQMYLVLTSADHVRTLSAHVDDLIRGAVVQPPDVPSLARSLAAELER